MSKQLLGPIWHPCEAGPKGTYKVRGLSGLEWLEMQELIEKESSKNWVQLAKTGQGSLSREQYEFALRHGLLGWRDLGAGALVSLAEGDEPPAFDKALVSEICLDHTQELTLLILARSRVGEDLEKNSSSQPKSPETAPPSTAPNANGGSTATP